MQRLLKNKLLKKIKIKSVSLAGAASARQRHVRDQPGKLVEEDWPSQATKWVIQKEEAPPAQVYEAAWEKNHKRAGRSTYTQGGSHDQEYQLDHRISSQVPQSPVILK